MTPETTTAGFTTSSDGAADPGPARDIGSHLLGLARGVARSVGCRVRDALRSAGALLPPLRVLVVDDSPDAADALAAVLDLLGCRTRACYDGPSALRAAA